MVSYKIKKGGQIAAGHWPSDQLELKEN